MVTVFPEHCVLRIILVSLLSPFGLPGTVKGPSLFNFHHSYRPKFRAYESDVAMLTLGSFRAPLLDPVKFTNALHRAFVPFSVLLHKTIFLEREKAKIIVRSPYSIPAWEGVCVWKT